MMKLHLLPFRVVFYLLRTIFFPSYLRWIFRMHWVVYFGLTLGVGYLANQEYQTYLSNRLKADLQISDGPPDVIPLSKWTAADNAPYNDEVRIRGLYFAALGQGEFDPTGLKRQYIMLADDQGREVKAVLVVWPQDMSQLEQQLAAQGSGDRIPVTVNGSLNTSSDWAGLIGTQLMMMNVPRAQDLVIVEPFIGDRGAAISERAEKTFGTVAVFGVIAGLLALIGLGRLLFGGKSNTAKRATPATKQPSKMAMSVGIPEASPWGTFQPTPPQPATPTDPPEAWAKTQKPKPAPLKDAPPPQPEFKSVFPGGGSGFRFKSSDEIIRQTFGTLSTLTPRKHDK